MARAAKPKTEVAVLPEPDGLERRAIEAAGRRNKNRTPPVAIKLGAGDGKEKPLEINAPHSDKGGWADRLADTFGSWSDATLNVSLGQLMRLSKHAGEPLTQDQVNAALAFVHAVNPENEMETALAVQMFGAHSLATTLLMRAQSTDRVDHMIEYGNLATKLQRTFTGQIEALAKLRRGGEQVVRHIHVDNRGGQAVIAETVNTGVAGNGRTNDQPHGQSAVLSALPGPNEAWNGMPVPGDARPEPMPAARRKIARRSGG